MTEKQLNDKPVLGFNAWRDEIKRCGDPSIDAMHRYDLDPDHTTISSLKRFTEELKQERKALIDETERYVYQFWKRLFNWDKKSVMVAMYGSKGFGSWARSDSEKDLLSEFVNCKAPRYDGCGQEERKCRWVWDNASIFIHNKVIGDVPFQGTDFLCVDLTSEPREGEVDEWNFEIPLAWLNPDYVFKDDHEFMEKLNRFREEDAYDRIFRHNTPEQEKAILEVLKSHPNLVKELADKTGKRIKLPEEE